MDGLEGEPSARVWAGIREATPATGTAASRVRYRIAAILIPAALVAGALITWNLLQQDAPQESGMVEQRQEQGLPTMEPKKSTPLAIEQPKAAGATDEAVEEDVVEPGTQPRQQTGVEPQEDAGYQKDSRNLPDQINMIPELDYQEVVDNQPKEQVMPNLKPGEDLEPAPQQEEIIAQETPQEEVVEEIAPEKGQQAGNSGSEKRQFAIADLRDMSMDDVKEKAGAFLGNVAQNASDKIGLQTDYTEEEIDAQHTRKKFSASLGKFSIKRVKKSKK